MSYPDPRYLAGRGEISAVLRRSGGEPELQIGVGANATAVSYLATGASTNGRFGLYRWDMGPESSGPSTHFHRTISESFFVLSGAVGLFDGESWSSAAPGDFLFVPEGGLHAFRNDSGAPASMLILFAPGAPREGYFEGLAEWVASGRQPSEEERVEFFLRHDTYWV
ncbi:MAG TPA: cupin domain-containing protein [Acidimicrobiia bacterium]|nr:cupin domain-containing protein [Acidimicrobiia bacterium]HEX2192253.1 cupin domain-containing protein [Acidimicrobiales bacterium]